MVAPSPAELDAIEMSQVKWATILGAEVEDDPDLGAVLIRYRDAGPGLNVAARIRWSPADVSARLADLQVRLKGADRWPSVIVSEGLAEPADLPQRLAAAGWAQVGGERVMFTRHAPVVPHLDPGLRVEAVTATSSIESVRLEAAVFGQRPDAVGEQAELLALAVKSGAVRGFLLRLLREPVATARLAPGNRVAGIHGVGVAANQRRRGYGRMITAVATRAGLATGHGLVWLSVDDANTAAVELYRGLGYESSFAWSRWLAPHR